MTTLISSVLQHETFVKSQGQPLVETLQSAKEEGVHRQRKHQVMADASASKMVQSLKQTFIEAGHTNFEVSLDPGDSYGDFDRLSTNSDIHLDKHIVRPKIYRRSSVKSWQSDEWSEYNLSVNSIKISAVSSVTGAPECHLRSFNREYGVLGNPSTGCESDVESVVSRYSLESDDVTWIHGHKQSFVTFNLEMNDDFIVSGGHESQISMESSLGGSQILNTETSGVAVEDPNTVTSDIESKIRRVQELLRLREEQSSPGVFTNDDDQSVTLHQQQHGLRKVYSFHASDVSALSCGTSETCWNASDYCMELNFNKQSAVSSVTGMYDKDLRVLSSDTSVESSLADDTTDFCNDINESSNAFDNIRDEIERIQALLDRR